MIGAYLRKNIIYGKFGLQSLYEKAPRIPRGLYVCDYCTTAPVLAEVVIFA